jgi:methionyl-tRNA formyltransferase
MDERMDVVFFGSGAFGVPTLRALAERHRVRAVVTQPDRPAGRGKKLTPNPIAEVAEREMAGVEVIRTERASAPEARESIRAVPAEAWVVIAFGQKLSPALLDGRFAVNLHASLLPRWRGAAPIHHAVLAGDVETGNSVITLADRMDAGLVLAQGRRPIGPEQTTGELHDLLASDGPELVMRVLSERASGREPGRDWGAVQDESLVTLAGKLGRDDAVVPSGATGERVRCLVNGLSPWPGVQAVLGGVAVKLLRAGPGGESKADDSHQEAMNGGSDCRWPRLVDAERGVFACPGGGTVRLMELQPAGGRAMEWATFVRGRAVARGAALLPAADGAGAA